MQKVPVDKRSCILLAVTFLFNRINVHDASMDYKHFMEVLGTVAGFSTVFYNIIKTGGEVSKMVSKLKHRHLSWSQPKQPQKPKRMPLLNEIDHLNARWKSESPKLFKRFQKFGIALMSAGGTAVLPGLTIPDHIMAKLHWPAWIGVWGGYFVVAGFCIGVVSKLTCSDTSGLPQLPPPTPLPPQTTTDGQP